MPLSPLNDKIRMFKSSFQQLANLLDDQQESKRSFKEVKQETIELFSPFFVNIEILDVFFVLALSQNRYQIKYIMHFPWAITLLHKALEDHRRAKSADEELSLSSSIEWTPNIYEGASISWSWKPSKDSFIDLEDEVYEIFKSIGDIAEGILKPFLGELVHKTRIARGISTTKKEILKNDLGNLVAELIDTSDYEGYLMPLPWSLRISDWRNIEAHKKWKVKQKQIICTFRVGRNSEEKKIVLSREDIEKVAERLHITALTLNLAYRIFIFENAQEISQLELRVPNLNLRILAKMSNLMASLQPLGFEIIDFQESEEGAQLHVRDLSDKDRAHELLSITYIVWALTKANSINVEYHKYNGEPYAGIKADGNLIEKEISGDVPSLTWFAEGELFEYVKTESGYLKKYH